MRHVILILITTTVMVALAGIGLWLLRPLTPTQPSKGISMITITSTAFSDGQDIPMQFTCDGENTPPEILVSPTPSNAKSIAITMTDPDSPDETWVHWTAWNLPPETTHITRPLIAAEAVEGTNTFGNIGYGGPCPAKGKHRYVFTVYVLDRMLQLENGASFQKLMDAMNGKIIDQASMTGLYQKVQS